jgi:thiol-disulfide isomerase/thioredoxin
MLKAIVAIAALGLVFLACGEVPEVAVVEGKILGADGKPPVFAHVHLLGLGDDLHGAVESMRAGDDGAFTVGVPRDKYYELAFTSVNHHSARVPLPMDLGRGIKGLEITLAANKYKEHPSNVRIVGDWNGFNTRAPEVMTPLGDGTFAYEREVQADTLAYQLLGVTGDGRSVNGTAADRYRYDGGGDYVSIVVVHGDTARVIFDPTKAVVAASPDLPRLEMPSRKHLVMEIFEINNRCALDSDNAMAALRAFWQEHGTIDGFEYDASAIRQYLLTKISGGGNLSARKYAAVKLAGLLDREIPLSDYELAAIGKLLSPTDWVWADSPMSLAEFFKRTEGDERMVDLFEQDLENVADKRVKATMLLEIGLAARETGDSAKQAAIYDELSNNYNDVNLPPMVQYRLASELDPNLRINKGKPLPDFKLNLVDGSGKISRQDLLGKYWLIDFWATWCGPCMGEMPVLHQAHEKFKGPDFEILSISFDMRPEDVREFRAGNLSMPWVNAFAEGAFESEIAKDFEVGGIPKPILVDPQGIIVETGMNLRGESLMAVLARYVGK